MKLNQNIITYDDCRNIIHMLYFYFCGVLVLEPIRFPLHVNLLHPNSNYCVRFQAAPISAPRMGTATVLRQYLYLFLRM